jgi:hypothetical protein
MHHPGRVSRRQTAAHVHEPRQHLAPASRPCKPRLERRAAHVGHHDEDAIVRRPDIEDRDDRRMLELRHRARLREQLVPRSIRLLGGTLDADDQLALELWISCPQELRHRAIGTRASFTIQRAEDPIPPERAPAAVARCRRARLRRRRVRLRRGCVEPRIFRLSHCVVTASLSSLP